MCSESQVVFLFTYLFLYTGKFAFFKAIVTGDPQPTVTWSRNNGDVSDTSRYQTKYDPHSNEHTFEVSELSNHSDKGLILL